MKFLRYLRRNLLGPSEEQLLLREIMAVMAGLYDEIPMDHDGRPIMGIQLKEGGIQISNWFEPWLGKTVSILEVGKKHTVNSQGGSYYTRAERAL